MGKEKLLKQNLKTKNIVLRSFKYEKEKD